MKLKGREIKGPNVEMVVIPRGEDDELVFKCCAVLDYTLFDELVSEPKPPITRKPGQASKPDTNNKKFQEEMSAYAEKRMQYMMLKSLEATEDLVWDTVNMNDPETWGNYLEEMRQAGLTEIEIGKLFSGMMSANCLNEAKIEEARQRFLARQSDQVE
jgi:hypothetical protein